MSRRQLGGFLALCLIWGSTWAAIRVAVEHMPPLRSVSLRFLVASAVLVPLAVLRCSRMPRGREWGALIAVGLLLVELPFSLVAWGEQKISSGMTSVLFATSPLLTLWMERRIGGDGGRRVPTGVALGMVGGLAGIVLVLCGELALSLTDLKRSAAIVFVVLCGSGTSVMAKRELKNIPVLTTSTVQCLLAGVLLGALSWVLEGRQRTDWTPASVGAILFLGLASTAVGFLLYYWLLRELEPHQLAARLLIMPVVAIAEGALLLGESMTWTMAGGTALVLCSLGAILRGVRPLEGDA